MNNATPSGEILRELGATEAFVAQVQRAATFCDTANNIACPVQLRSEVPLEPEVLRRAVARAVARHPLLRARIERVPRGPLRRWLRGGHAFAAVAPEEAFTLAVHRDVDWRDVVRRCLQEPWTLDGGPLLRVHLITHAEDPALYELVFWVCHAIADGGSLFAVITEILETAAALIEVGGDAGLLPPVEPAPVPDVIWSHAPPRRIRWLQLIGAISHYITTPLSPRVRKLPLDGSRAPETSRTGYYHQTLTPEESAAVVARARALESSVGGLVGAALMLALPAAPGVPPYTGGLSTIVDLRRMAQPPIPIDALSHCASQVQTYHQVERGTQLGDLARQVQAQVIEVVQSGVPWDVGRLIRIFIPVFLGLLRRGPIRFPYSVVFSNVGRLRVPTRIGPFEVLQCHGLADFSFGEGNVFLALITFNERMTLNWTFGRVAEATVRAYAARVREILLEET